MGKEQTHEVLDAQNHHWEKAYTTNPEMFGDEPSEPARKAVEAFTEAGVKNLLELGGGQGRDTIYFAQNGFTVTTLDYADEGVKAIAEKADKAGLSKRLRILRHDVRNPLPFPDASFDACYSHMLFCMALTTVELEFLSSEIRRVLKSGGLNIYTVRHTGDPHYGTRINRGEDMYEVNGFIVHFFSREKVEHLARGYEIVSIDEFEEGPLPRRLFRVTLKRIEV
ncbi:class I SAM-dependent methyltransferase [Oryzomonas rubra]|uniref:Class I SAM-dependent methyltransferase n=1 Tax=Oryzomonas rubra TaxID=2509454 RepID=A0A5A9X4U0_9BACT|nr:class I SAM-dependent methyltransferase [Oryzomonas rubra]KAA0888162.1 class I SAM-dependent methyltransferase [Oryzomonas rubra]